MSLAYRHTTNQPANQPTNQPTCLWGGGGGNRGGSPWGGTPGVSLEAAIQNTWCDVTSMVVGAGGSHSGVDGGGAGVPLPNGPKN